MAAESATRDLPVPSGEFPFTWEDFRQIAALVHSSAGIVLNENKANLVYSRVVKRLRSLGLKSFRDYCEMIARDGSADERQQLVAAMTTNVTRFYREAHHFDFLRTRLLPDLADRARAGGRVRIWSAGCSSGEEPYSIALTVASVIPDFARHDIRILATDIDPVMIERGAAALYQPQQLTDIPPALKAEWFRPAKGDPARVKVRSELTDLVRFRQLNLHEDWPMAGKFDVIFCRNTMIYFDDPTQDRLVRRFHDILQPGGHLLIGHSERIRPAAARFDLIAQTTYRRMA